MVSVGDIKKAETFKEAIDLFLRMTNMTYEELAIQMGYSKAHTYGVCKGTYKITIDFLNKLRDVTKLDRVFWITLWLDTYDEEY